MTLINGDLERPPWQMRGDLNLKSNDHTSVEELKDMRLSKIALSMIGVALFAAFLSTGCRHIQFTPDYAVLEYGDDYLSIEHKFDADTTRKICDALNKYKQISPRRVWLIAVVVRCANIGHIMYGSRLNVSSKQGGHIIRMRGGDEFHFNDKEDVNIGIFEVKGLFDLIKKPLIGLEIEYLGTYPIGDVPDEKLDYYNFDFDKALQRTRKHLHLNPWPPQPYDPRPEYIRANTKKNLLAFQKWYNANHQKIRWDQKEKRYVIDKPAQSE